MDSGVEIVEKPFASTNALEIVHSIIRFEGKDESETNKTTFAGLGLSPFISMSRLFDFETQKSSGSSCVMPRLVFGYLNEQGI